MEGRFNGGFFALPVWALIFGGAYTWRGLFSGFYGTLKAKQKELKRQGKDNKPKATTALSDEEIDIFYSKKVLGLSSPLALVNTV